MGLDACRKTNMIYESNTHHALATILLPYSLAEGPFPISLIPQLVILIGLFSLVAVGLYTTSHDTYLINFSLHYFVA